jgi:hypothetical protein
MVPAELTADDRVVALEQIPPPDVPEPCRELGRADDVSEQDRGEHALGRRSAREAGDEALGRGHRRLVDVIADPGVDAPEWGQIDDLGAPDPLRGVARGAWDRWPRKDERRHADGGEDVANVQLHRGPERREGRTRAQAAAHVPHEPVPEGNIVGDLRSPLAREALQVGPLTPAGPDLGKLLAPLLRGRGPRVVRGPGPPDPRINKSKAQAPIRVRCREEHAQAGARAAAPQHGALGAGRIHDSSDIVHGRVERLHLANTVGQACPALVEHQHAPECGQTFDMADEHRLFPGREKVACDPAHEDDIRRPIADYLVCDRDVAASRIGHVGRLHAGSVLHRGRSCRLATPTANAAGRTEPSGYNSARCQQRGRGLRLQPGFCAVAAHDRQMVASGPFLARR